jgi:hypothetical protein
MSSTTSKTHIMVASSVRSSTMSFGKAMMSAEVDTLARKTPMQLMASTIQRRHGWSSGIINELTKPPPSFPAAATATFAAGAASSAEEEEEEEAAAVAAATSGETVGEAWAAIERTTSSPLGSSGGGAALISAPCRRAARRSAVEIDPAERRTKTPPCPGEGC